MFASQGKRLDSGIQIFRFLVSRAGRFRLAFLFQASSEAVGAGDTSLQASSYQSYPRDLSCSSYYRLTSQAGVNVFAFTIGVAPGGVQPSGTGGTSTATVTVSTSPNTPNRPVALSADAVLSSGGHVDHTGARPTGSFAPASGNTNGSGIFQATYTAPIFGGTMNIKAQMRAQIKSTTLQIYVPGLLT